MKYEQVCFGDIKISACFIWRDRQWLKLDKDKARFGNTTKTFESSDCVEVQ
jgi:phage gp29-like protein